MERVVVTGGAGFIGSHLVAKLADRFDEVMVIDNLSFGRREHLPEGKWLHFVEGDITDGVALASELRRFRPQVLFHLAALHFIPYCNDHPWEAARVNIGGTHSLVDCLVGIPLRTLFFASSAAVYPPRNGPNREDSPLGPTDIYGMTKLIGESLAELYHRRTGTRTIVGRFFNVYGLNETNPHVIPEIIAQVRPGERRIALGNTRPKRDFIHVSDVVGAVLALVERSELPFGVFNIGSGKEYSVLEVVRAIETVLGEEIEIVSDETRFRECERLHLLADIDRLHQTTEWSPQMSLEDGLREMLR